MPTFLTEPQWYDKNGNLTSTEKIKVDNATHADDSDRSINYFGKNYNKLDWMTSVAWQGADGEWGDVGSLLLSGESVNVEGSNKENAYLEVLPAVMNYTFPEAGSACVASVNLGKPSRPFGKIYADYFEGTATKAITDFTNRTATLGVFNTIGPQSSLKQFTPSENSTYEISLVSVSGENVVAILDSKIITFWENVAINILFFATSYNRSTQEYSIDAVSCVGKAGETFKVSDTIPSIKIKSDSISSTIKQNNVENLIYNYFTYRLIK